MMKIKAGRKRILKNKECPVCAKKFRPNKSIQKYCSYICSLDSRPKKGAMVLCAKCGSKQYRRQSHINSPRHKNDLYFCSMGCKKLYDYGGKVDRKCLHCKKDYKTFKSQIEHRGESKYCSVYCKRKDQKEKYIAKKGKSKTKNAHLKKTLWIYFSKYIRQRDGGICISCGKKDDWKKMDAGHYIPKTAGLSIYFDEQNVNCQCTYCNRWQHGNLSRYAISLRLKHGSSILEDLDRKRLVLRKITDKEYIDLITLYKNKLIESGFSFK